MASYRLTGISTKLPFITFRYFLFWLCNVFLLVWEVFCRLTSSTKVLYISFFSENESRLQLGKEDIFFRYLRYFWNFFQKRVMIISFSLVWPFLTNVSAPSFVYDANRKRIWRVFFFVLFRLNAIHTLLESFGNSRTVMNANATRFTQIFSVDCDHSGLIVSASVQVTDQLEKVWQFYLIVAEILQFYSATIPGSSSQPLYKYR